MDHPGTDEERPRGVLSPGGTRVWETAGFGWQPLWLTADEVVDAARRAFGVPVQDTELLADGMLNQTWRLHCPDHDRALRVSRTERTVEQVRYEHAFAAAVAPSVPALVAAETVEVPVVHGRALSLYPFVSGVSGLSLPVMPRARATAELLAALHRASLPLGLPQRPGFLASDERSDGYGWAELRVAALTRFGPGDGLAAAVATIDRELDRLDRWLAALHADGRLDVRACVHGDTNPRNTLFRDGRLIGLVDVDDCRVEPLVWEVAQTAYGAAGVDPDEVWAVYRAAGGPLPDHDRDLLLGFARMGSLSELVWFIEDGQVTHLAADGIRTVAGQLTGTVARND